jgi:hypothetical protein
MRDMIYNMFAGRDQDMRAVTTITTWEWSQYETLERVSQGPEFRQETEIYNVQHISFRKITVFFWPFQIHFLPTAYSPVNFGFGRNKG